MSIGSHTKSHPILSMLDSNQIFEEMGGSKRIIEEGISKPVDSIAYPVGQKESMDARVISFAEKTGYKVAFSFVDGVDQTNRYSIGRLHLAKSYSLNRFAAKLAFPSIFCD